MNFKEFIEKFLQKSLMIYLRFNDDKKKLMSSMGENIMMNKDGLEEKKNNESLEKIDEVEDGEDDEERENPEVYDIFGANESASNEENEKAESEESEKDEDASEDKSVESEDNKDKTVSVDKSSESVSEKIERSLEKNKSKALSVSIDMHNKSQEVKLSNSLIPDGDVKSNNEYEMGDHVEKLKFHINKKFVKKVDKILEFLQTNSIKFENEEDSPLYLLTKLKDVSDIYERNEIIDKIENLVTELFKLET